MTLLEKLKSQRLYFDGGSGTYFQSCGLKPGEMPEIWNITNPKTVEQMHTDYLNSGSDIITTNTFGANVLKFSGENGGYSLEEIVSAAVKNAKNAIKNFGGEKYVALDIGPTGRLLKPLGDLEFEDAVNIFANTVKIGVKCGVDLILIETMNDSLETKAAVLAAKENSSLPIFATNAYDENGSLMTGASPSAMVALLEGLKVDALGINCSLGPEKMMPIIEEILKYSSTPVIVNPNAGLPVIRNGKTEYDVSSTDFARSMVKIAEMGATVLGGCCGTTPEYIKEMKSAVEGIKFVPISPKNITVISSYTHTVEFLKKPVLIGERINPTGKKAMKEALKSNNFDYILNEAVSQQEKGANVLDVNTGLPEIDETSALIKAVKLIQTVSDLPLQIDTASSEAMEGALRVYNGKPILNSVSGKKEVMDKIFPLAAKYGGVIIALTLDENGIPATSDGRIAIAEKIINEAEKYGIFAKDIIFDPLAMTISSDSSSALVTLECIKKLNKMGLKSSLGVSNVSFGLPKRGLVNSAFFTMAMQNGLNAAIINPHSDEMMNAYFAYCALANLDNNCENYISYAAKIPAEAAKTDTEKADDKTLFRAILKGLDKEAAQCAKTLLQTNDALEIIDKSIIPALDEMGLKFEKKEAFLPQLLMSAEAAKAAFDVIKIQISSSGISRRKKCKFVLATVKGDIHDIGKNIVKVLLENYDFDVIDLGKDVEPKLISDTAVKENAPIVGLSALMTTTVPAMEETIKLLRKTKPDCKIVVGGAVLTEEYADMIGADKYAKDAMATVRYAESLV